MTELQASRTLVKSPPELWAECSDAASLARHLDQFGEIRITRLDPETAVAWEGEHARGTVTIEPAGWGTRVILTAVAVVEESPPVAEEPIAVAPVAQEPVAVAPVAEEPVAVAPVAEEPVAVAPVAEEPPDQPAEPDPATEPPRRRRFAWLFARRRPPGSSPEPEPDPGPVDGAVAPEPEPVDTPAPEPEPIEAAVPEPEPEPPTVAPDTEAALAAALDSLGQAHHRPFSRA